MRRIGLCLLLVAVPLILYGCGKVGLKDPVYLHGLGHNPTPASASPKLPPTYNNGDIVRHKLLDKYGIMMSNSYRFFPNLNAWYCIVDFYPSSAIHFDFSDFDNYERRYVYEYELTSACEFDARLAKVPARWRSMVPLVVCK